MHSKKIIVIGGNAAGPSAAAKAKRVDPNADIKMFEAGEFISTGTCELPYLISGDIEDYRKIIFFDEKSFFEKKGVQVYTRHKVDSIDRKNRNLQITNLKDDSKHIYSFDKLIICTGSLPKKIPELTNQLNNVFYLKSVRDYLNIKKYCNNYSVKKVLIMGSGYIGLEATDAFTSQGIKVELMEKEQCTMPNGEIELQNLIAETIRKHGVEFHGSMERQKFIIDENVVKGIKREGRVKEYDLVLVSTGVAPNNSLSVNAKLEMGAFGGVKVNSRQQTSDHNIYAAGDNTEVFNLITNRPEYIPLATLAHSQGHVAGANAAGGHGISKPVVSNISVKIFDKTYSSVGITSQIAKELHLNYKTVSAISSNLVSVMPESSKVFGKIVFNPESRRIYGASFFGREEVVGYADIISTLIQNNIQGDKLFEINFNYTPPRSPFINLLSILGRKIREA